MNRQQKRQLAKSQRRGTINQGRVVPLPRILDEFTVFDIPQSLMDKIKNGYVDVIQGVPVLRDNTGQLCEVAPALAGWIFTWMKISQGLNLNLSLQYMGALEKRLSNGMIITVSLLKHCQDELDQCRKAFRTQDRDKITSIAKTANIQLLMNTDK